ncbi:MAG: hypothetical protein IJW38_02575 [Clostridia bacterium]|nr:hypothetical protein [Clostridia bacterium]
MNRKSLIYKVYFGVILSVIAAAVTMRIVACLNDMNFATGYFEDKLLINVSDTVIVISAFFALSYLFAEPRDKKLIFNFSSPLNYVFAGTLGIAFLFFSRHSFELFKYYKTYVENYIDNPFFKTTTEKLLSYISFALGVLAIVSVAHFILASLIVKDKDTRRADFGLITVIFLSLYATFLYFSNDLPINAPSKIIDQSAYLATALFFLFETRISIGRERWRAYRAFGFIALLLTAYSSIPSLIVYLTNGVVISNSIYETVLTLALALFIGARLALTSFLREDTESKTVTLIKSAFAMREEEINPKEESKYDPETDEELFGISLEDRGDYYELNFEDSENEQDALEIENEEDVTSEENTGN